MDHRARVGRSYFYGGVYVRSGRTADQYRNSQPPAFQLFADVDHLLERRGNQSAQADRVGAPGDGFVDDAGTFDHHAQVADRVAVAGHDYRHDVLADVVYVAFHGSHQHLAGALGVRFGTLLDVGSQYGDGFFHHAGGLDHLRQEHFALPEQIAYDLHGRHQQPVDHCQGRTQRAVAFERVLLDVVGHALEHGVFDALAERLRAPGVGMLRLRRAGFGELRGVFREAFGGVCAAAEDNILDPFEQFRFDVAVDLQHLGIDDRHVHTRLDGVVEKHRMHGLAHGVVAPEGER